MTYFTISSNGGTSYTLLKSNQSLKTITKFYVNLGYTDTCIQHSYLPSMFLDTLPLYENKTYSYTTKHSLDVQFISWIYKNSITRSMLNVVHIYSNMTNFLAGGLMKAYDYIAQKTIHQPEYDEEYSDEEEEEVVAEDEDENEGIREQDNSTQDQNDEHIQLTESEGKKLKLPEQEALITEVQSVPMPSDSKTDDSIFHMVDGVLLPKMYKSTKVDPANVDVSTYPAFNEDYPSVSSNPHWANFAPHSPISGFAVFKRRTGQMFCDLFADVQDVFVRPTTTPIQIKNDFKIVVQYLHTSTGKKGVALFEQSVMNETDDLYLLKNLNEIAIQDVVIKHISIFPLHSIIEPLISYHKLESKVSYATMDEYLLTLYNMHKCISDDIKIKGLFIKSVIEFLSSFYEIDMNSSVQLSDLYANFQKQNGVTRTSLTVVIDSIKMFTILDFLGYMITDDKVLFLRAKDHGAYTTLNLKNDYKLKQLLQTSYVNQISHQLRQEPACNVNIFTSPWQESPHIEYMPLDNIKGTTIIGA